MFGTTATGSGLTFGKVLGGISKTLSIANQVIPLYKEAKPIINNAKTIMNVLKGLNTTNTNNNILTEEKNTTEQIKIPKNSTPSTTNSPIFFQ